MLNYLFKKIIVYVISYDKKKTIFLMIKNNNKKTLLLKFHEIKNFSPIKTIFIFLFLNFYDDPIYIKIYLSFKIFKIILQLKL